MSRCPRCQIVMELDCSVQNISRRVLAHVERDAVPGTITLSYIAIADDVLAVTDSLNETYIRVLINFLDICANEAVLTPTKEPAAAKPHVFRVRISRICRSAATPQLEAVHVHKSSHAIAVQEVTPALVENNLSAISQAGASQVATLVRWGQVWDIIILRIGISSKCCRNGRAPKYLIANLGTRPNRQTVNGVKPCLFLLLLDICVLGSTLSSAVNIADTFTGEHIIDTSTLCLQCCRYGRDMGPPRSNQQARSHSKFRIYLTNDLKPRF